MPDQNQIKHLFSKTPDKAQRATLLHNVKNRQNTKTTTQACC